MRATLFINARLIDPEAGTDTPGQLLVQEIIEHENAPVLAEALAEERLPG